MRVICAILLMGFLVILGVAQTILPKLPDEPVLLTFQDYPLVYTPRYDKESQGFQPNMYCSPVPNPQEIAPEFLETVGKLNLESAIPFVASCSGGGPNPHGSVQDKQIAVGFEKDKLTLFLSVEKNFTDSRNYSKGMDDTFYYNDIGNMSTDLWTVIDENGFGFVQTITWSSTTRHVNTAKGTEEIERYETFKKIYNLFSINEEGIIRLVYSLPLADYEWTGDKPTPDLIDQLQVQISENTLRVTALDDGLTDLQKSWVGTFSLNRNHN